MEYTTTRGPITSWAAEERPREKLLQRGVGALTDSELVAIILGSGTRTLSALDLARKLLHERGKLQGLAQSDVAELQHTSGIGPAKAIQIVAAFELGRRKREATNSTFRMSGSQAVADYLQPRMEDLRQEVFYGLFLNQNNELLVAQPLFQGGVSSTVVDTKVVFHAAIKHLASAIIVAHNHPSGNLQPSQADIQLTHRLVRAGRLLNIRVLDHIIISHRGYYSFLDDGRLNPGD